MRLTFHHPPGMRFLPPLTAITALLLCVWLRAGGKRPVLTDLAEATPDIRLDLRYATEDNFFRRKFYPEARALLRPSTAAKLAKAQQEFGALGLHLKVWDAWRPRRVQREMWKVMPNPDYVADPAKGSRHNRGAAVDVTLVDKDGRELEMPTGFDDFSLRAQADAADVSDSAKQNRTLLRGVMERHGFRALRTEWWHFDDKDWEQFDMLE